MHAPTPFEVKRLEYQLRIDAATKCPGTTLPDDEPEEPVGDNVSLARLVTRLLGAVHAITAPLKARRRAKAH